jgi:ATP-dependent DNA helicase RecQ
VPLPPRDAESIPEELGGRIQPTIAAADVLNTPRALARFLCGLSSPRLGRARIGKDPFFGTLAGVPFPTVLTWAEKHLISES